MDVGALSAEVRAESLAAMTRVYDSGSYIAGAEVLAFERECAPWFDGASRCIGVSNGTDALVCALGALGIGPGARVLTTPLTFFATASAIGRVGATPVFADVEPDSWLLDPAAVSEVRSVDAVLAVHLFGRVADVPALESAAPGAVVIEDAAQAWGARFDGKPVGSLGALGCFSFFPAKPLGACGDAGLVVTADAALEARCRALRVHGRETEGIFTSIGGNYRLDELQAALLRVRLERVRQWLTQRRRNAEFYLRELADISELTLPLADDARSQSAWAVFSVRVNGGRDALRQYLTERGIGTAVYYPVPVHLQPAMGGVWRPGQFPVAERLSRELLALPVGPELDERALGYVCENVRRFFGK